MSLFLNNVIRDRRNTRKYNVLEEFEISNIPNQILIEFLQFENALLKADFIVHERVRILQEEEAAAAAAAETAPTEEEKKKKEAEEAEAKKKKDDEGGNFISKFFKGIGDFLKKIWEHIKKFFKWIGDSLTGKKDKDKKVTKKEADLMAAAVANVKQSTQAIVAATTTEEVGDAVKKAAEAAEELKKKAEALANETAEDKEKRVTAENRAKLDAHRASEAEKAKVEKAKAQSETETYRLVESNKILEEFIFISEKAHKDLTAELTKVQAELAPMLSLHQDTNGNDEEKEKANKLKDHVALLGRQVAAATSEIAAGNAIIGKIMAGEAHNHEGLTRR